MTVIQAMHSAAIMAIGSTVIVFCGCAAIGGLPMFQNGEERAADDNVSVEVRIAAARSLNSGQQIRLARRLEARLPGHLDIQTGDTVRVLAEVGDTLTYAKLNELSVSYDLAGPLSATVDGAKKGLAERLRIKGVGSL